jgi:predicted ribosome quality control (RQC) complex YloA/Tae2 family protein
MAELSGFEVLALLKEIDLALRGTYVNNIFSIGTSQLLRLRKQDAPDNWLVVSPKKGVWLSEKVSERAETTEFTSKLRGQLERARFEGASQVDLDRVFKLGFQGEGGRQLIVELMPPGNIIVLDGEGRVVLALEEVRSSTRRVVKGERYQPPKQSRLSPAEVGVDDVRTMWGKEKTVGKAIGRHVALPRKYVSEVLSRLGLPAESPSSSLHGREEEVVSVIRGMVDEARNNPRPYLCKVADEEDIFVIAPHEAKVTASAGSVSELCDRLLLGGATTDETPPTAEEVQKRELEITISRLKAESETLTGRATKVRSSAAVASASGAEEARRMLTEYGISEAREPASSSAAASALYDYAKKLELRSAESLEAARKLEKKLVKVRPKGPSSTKPLTKRKQEWYEKFRWFITTGGKLAIGGRDAQSNTLLIKRHLEDNDIVYHADLFGSPFFVLKDGRLQSEQEVLELAQATVSFSSGWKTGLGAADAYWVFRDQVSGSAESGEYLAKGSFVIRGKKNFVRHALLQVAVGRDVEGRIFAGPEPAVARASVRYVVLTPHREKPTDTAKKVLKELSAPGESAPGLDDVLRALPPGGGKIVRRKSGPTGSGQTVISDMG